MNYALEDKLRAADRTHVSRVGGIHSHLENGGYVSNQTGEDIVSLLNKFADSSSPANVVIRGSRGCGKSATIQEFLRGTTCKYRIIGGEQLNQNGNIAQITKLMRSVSTVAFTEQQNIVEGEVVSIAADKLTLKTVDMESVFDIGANIHMELEREKVVPGSIIRVYRDAGFVKSIGRTAIQTVESDNMFLPIIPVPEGECCRVEETVTVLTIDEVDLINHKESGTDLFYTSATATEAMQGDVDAQIDQWLKEKKVTFNKGVVIVEEAQTLSSETLARILMYKGKKFAPLVILEYTDEEGCKQELPEIILNRAFIAKVLPLTESMKIDIIRERAAALHITLSPDVLKYLQESTGQLNLSYMLLIIQVYTAESIIVKESLLQTMGLFKPM